MSGFTNILMSYGARGIGIQDLFYFDTMYDATNNVVIASGGNFDDGAFVAVSTTGGTDFTLVNLFPYNDNVPDGHEKFYLMNDPDSEEYIGISFQGDTKPTVIYATWADPLTWQTRTTIDEVGDFDRIHGIANNGAGTYVVIGIDSSGSPNDLFIVRSTDNGNTWTYFDYDETAEFTIDDAPGEYEWTGITYNGTNFIAVARAFDQGPDFESWAVVSDDNGATWDDYTISSTHYDWLGTDNSGNVLLVWADSLDSPAGDFNTARSTTGGVSWSIDTAGGNSVDITVEDVVYDASNTRFVAMTRDAGAGDNKIFTSNSTGLTWTEADTVDPGQDWELSTITYASTSGLYIAGGFGGLWVSPDDFSGWTLATEAL